MGQPKPLTRDQLAKFLGNNQEAIRRFEQLFQIAGTDTPEDVTILFRRVDEADIAAADAAASANEALAALQLFADENSVLANRVYGG